ncbi:hypothetical protein KFE18_05025 [Clostridiaceae bacterium Marseille-Q4143]|nr:hypothetical protein KFE18_05025 [Clostridiaceae bacterium Marseille-Q4143]
MVSVKDFKPGQTAYILTRKRGRTQEHFVSQCIVVSVGRKYVKTAKQESDSITSDFYNLRGDDDYLSETDYYNTGRRLFPTQQAAIEDIEKDMLKDWISKATQHSSMEKYTVQQLREVKKILEAK